MVLASVGGPMYGSLLPLCLTEIHADVVQVGRSLLSKVIPERLQGAAFALVRGSLGFFSLAAPVIGGQLWERVSPRFPFQLTAWATLLSVIPMWLKFKLPDKKGACEEIRHEVR